MSKRGVNKVILMGRLGQDPEVKYTPNGDAVTNFSLATSEVWKDKTTGQQQERSEWHRCVAWRKVGEIIGEYCRKGDMLYLEGHLQTRKWQDQQGQDRYQTEIVVDDIQLIGGKKEGGQPAQQKQAPANNQRSAPSTQQAPDFDGFDDDIPFN